LTRRPARPAALLPCLLAFLIAFVIAHPAAAAWIEYLVIEANEGGSSGGHAAIRFAERAYHFQNTLGQLRLVRDRTRELLYDYVLTGNRGVRASRIDVSDETWQRLRERFETRHFAQQRQSALLQSLTRERRLLERLVAASGPVDLALPAAGYLEYASPSEASPALAGLRRRIEQTRGSGFLAERRRSIEDRLQALDPASTLDPPWSVSPDLAPPPSFTFADRYIELASTLAALDRIENGSRLRAAGNRTLAEDDVRLAPAEIEALERAAALLDTRLLELATMDTPEPGHALLVALARRAAIERSLRTGRLVVLDTYSPEAHQIETGSGPTARQLLEPLLADARTDLDRAREALVGADSPAERTLAALEEVANRYAEVAAVRHDGGAIRLQRYRMVPMLPAVHAVPRPRTPATQLESALSAARRREQQWQSALDDLHDYNLVSHNCVSAIFDTLHAEFEDPKSESTLQLGGYVDPGGPLRFWPLMSAAAVRHAYRISGEWRLASFRRDQLARMRSSENDLLVALRESNSLTARSYSRSALGPHSRKDSFFLFFTDGPETIPVRPILGAVNLAASLLETTWGALRAPKDGGQTFLSGLSGITMSGAELGFVNIRKGSNRYVGRAHRARIDAALAN